MSIGQDLDGMTSAAPHADGGAPRKGVLGAALGSGRLSARRAALGRVLAEGPSEKRARTQAQLLEAGRLLFAEKGIGATSVGDLCTAAGYSRGAFYSNFSDMDHFVRRLAQEQWSEMAAYARAAVAEALPAPDAAVARTDEGLEAAIAQLAERILRAMPVSRTFFLLQGEFVAHIVRDEEGAPALRRAYEEFKGSLRELLVLGLDAIGRECLLSPDDTTELIVAAAERSMRSALMSGDDGALTAQFDRTLPALLAHLTRPVA